MSVKINVNGKAINEFKIVYSASDIYAAKVFAYRLQRLLSREYGYTVEVLTDDTSATDNEIVVGNTNRGTVGASDTAISLVAEGGKLYIASPKSVGYEHVYSTIEEDLKNGVEYADGYSFAKELSELLSDGSENAISKTGDVRIMFNNIWIFEKNPPFTTETPELIAPAPFRARQLADIYRDYKPAILGLQEYGSVSCNKYMINEQLKPLIEALGYRELYSNNSAQLAIFYDPKLVSLSSFGLHQFTVGQPRGVLWGLFRDKATKNSFICATTHFAWAPVWEDACAHRIIHAKETVDLLKKLYDMYKLPIIIGGDFNQGGASAPIKILEEAGFVNVVHLAKNAAAQRSHHPYPHYNSTEDCVPEKVFRPEGNYVDGIDHSFAYNCDDSIQFETQAIIKDWFAVASSDHCPVLVDFSFKNED